MLRCADGRYYLDTESEPQRVAAEIDGLAHLEVSRWLPNLERQNALVIGGLTVVRFASFRIRRRPAYVVQTLRRLGRWIDLWRCQRPWSPDDHGR